MASRSQDGDVMNWKEFLKPDKRKLITFLLIIALALAIIGILNLAFCQSEETDISSNGPFVILVENFDTLSLSVCNLNNILPIILVRLPLWYLIACISIFIHDKYIKKKSKGV